MVNTFKSMKIKPASRVNPRQTGANSDFLSYAKCRIDPLSSGPSVGIPDSDANRKIVVDYRCYADLTITAAGGINVLTTPTLPLITSVQFVGSAGNISNNASSIPCIASGSGSQTYNPAIVPPELAALAAAPVFGGTTAAPLEPGSYTNPYAGTQARIVSCATRVFYTGVAMNCSGTMQANSVAWSPSDDPEINAVPVSWLTNASGTAVSQSPGQVFWQDAQFTPQAATYAPDTVVLRTEQGCYAQLKHNSSKYNWRPFRSQPTILTVGNFGSATGTTSHSSLFADSVDTRPGVYFWDADWSPSLISVGGLAAGSTLRIETYFCVEIQVRPNSPYNRLAKECTMGNDLIVQKISQVVRNVPTAIAATASTDPWYIQAAQIIGKIAKSAAIAFL